MKLPIERELTPIENEVLKYIRTYPGTTAEDVANALGNDVEVYNAVAYLQYHLYVDRDNRNMALKAR